MTSMPPLFHRHLRQTLVWSCIATAIFAAGLQAAPTEDRPNILFCIADDWSFGHAGAYDCRWVNTPGFDRVADQGLLFTRAYTPNAKCAPSRACILTGRNSWQLKEAANHWCDFPPEFKTWAEALAENGYFVGTTGKGWGPGYALDASGKNRRMTGQPFNQRKATPPARGIGNNDYAGNFEDFIQAVPSGQPWSFWYGAVEPHRGYEYGAGVAKGGKRLSDIDRVPGYWPDNETVRNDILDYGFEVEHFDRHVARILDSLDKRGQLDNTLVIVTSDHGMPFPRAKGQAYDESNHVPLALMWKKGLNKPGRRVEDYVSFIDLAPTILEVAGVRWADSGMAPSPGRSLTDIMRSDRSGWVNRQRDHVLIGKERHDIGRPHDWGYPIRGIIKDDLLYLQNFEPERWPGGNPETGYLNCDGGPTKTDVLEDRRANGQSRFWDLCFGKRPPVELYQVAEDPDCLNNLADSLDYASRKAELKEQMERELQDQEDPRLAGQGHIFDDYPYAVPGQRGFYERYMRGEKIQSGWVSPSDFEKKPLP